MRFAEQVCCCIWLRICGGGGGDREWWSPPIQLRPPLPIRQPRPPPPGPVPFVRSSGEFIDSDAISMPGELTTRS